MQSLSQRFIPTTQRAVESDDRRVPTGLRSIVGPLLVAGNVLGFSSVLGFWILQLLAWLKRRDVRSLRERQPQTAP